MTASKKEEPIIEVKHLSKQYNIGVDTTYKTLSESVTSAVKHPIKTLKDFRRQSETFWALKDVNFEVEKGEVLGIIGRNGAGKSTLLKVLSRITSPTEGEVHLRGRVGSLLEVGTGFHPELSGRENVFFNGAILGMKKKEIDEKFDEIVKFSGVEKFLDTPVKRYSSGMQVRLAFSVAANLDPEILVVDEVLAVGDAAFQKKCLGKMEEVAEGGRTVLFVSHNMGAVSHLCQKGIVIENGSVVFNGTSENAVEHYNHLFISKNNGIDQQPHVIYYNQNPLHAKDIAITSVETYDLNGKPKSIVSTFDNLIFRIKFYSNEHISKGAVELHLNSGDGSTLLVLSTQPDGTLPIDIKKGENIVDCIIYRLPLAAGDYIFGAGLSIPNIKWLWLNEQMCKFTVVEKDIYNSGKAPKLSRCLLAIEHEWRVNL